MDEAAAIFGLADEIVLPLEADHAHLSKFSSNSDVNYIRISGIIEQWSKLISGHPLPPFMPSQPGPTFTLGRRTNGSGTLDGAISPTTLLPPLILDPHPCPPPSVPETISF